MQGNGTVGKGQKAVIKPEKPSDTLGFTFPDAGGGWCSLRDEQREHFATETLVKREVATDCDDLVVGMGGDDQHTLPLLNRTELDRHTVSEAVNAAEETRCSSLKYAVEECRSLHLELRPSSLRVAALPVGRPRCWTKSTQLGANEYYVFAARTSTRHRNAGTER